MANGGHKKKPLKSEDEDNLGYLSDESDFYGDTATKEYFNKQAAGFDAAAWWHNRVPLLSEIADANAATREEMKSVKQYNTYEGVPSARQLSETVDAFLQRLPPATTEQSPDVGWIWIANPYIPRKSHDKARQEDFGNEGPPDEESDLLKFCTISEGLLQEFQDTKSAIEKEMHGKSRTSIDKAVNKKRGETIDKIQQTAVDTRVTVGKWLLFPETENVNAYWARVARATAANELGIAAKVAPYDISRTRMPRLICVYTKDFKDKEDLDRVVKKLKDLDLVQKGKPIWYKPDAYTYLRIERDNEWGIKPSIHGSNDFLQPKNKKIDDFVKRKYVDMED